MKKSNHYQPQEKKRVMWGKHAGKLFSEIPTEYLEWFIANAFPHMRNRKQWAINELKRRQKDVK